MDTTESELNMVFKGKTALVTGAGQGIGFEICRQLAAQGAVVFLNDLDAALAENAAARIRADGGRCTAMPGDTGDVSFVRSMVDGMVTQQGRLDIVIANAGITLFGDFFTYTPENFHALMRVNVAGTFFLVQAAALHMKQQTGGGSILLTSSVTGHQAYRSVTAYGMSKAAVEMLAKSLVTELSAFNININAVAPGATLTERTLDDPDYENTWKKLTPMGRPATTADIAHTALFLVSDEARHITGQTLVVDGGWTSVSPGSV